MRCAWWCHRGRGRGGGGGCFPGTVMAEMVSGTETGGASRGSRFTMLHRN